MWYASIGGGSVEAAELLLDHGAPVDQESDGTTALHWAARDGQLDLARFVLERGADPRAVGRSGESGGAATPLDSARSSGNAAMVELIEEW